MTEEERIFKGELFASEVPELVAKKLKAHRFSQEYSNLFEEDTAERERILHDLLAIVGGSFGPDGGASYVEIANVHNIRKRNEEIIAAQGK